MQTVCSGTGASACQAGVCATCWAKPARIVEITAQTGLNSLNAVNADVIPEFEGAKALAQRDTPAEYPSRDTVSRSRQH